MREMPSKCSGRCRTARRQLSVVVRASPFPLPADSPAPPGAASRRASSGTGKKFTWQELAEHNSRGDALISIRGKVGVRSGQLAEPAQSRRDIIADPLTS